MNMGSSVSPVAKTAILFFCILGVIVVTFSLVVQNFEGDKNRVRFQLTSHEGAVVSQQDLSGRHLLVFFGFTNCRGVCPTQMSKLSQAMLALDQSGHGHRIRPVFISVDPERDTPDRVAEYLSHFDSRFIGLTGSRPELRSAANSFATLLEELDDEKVGDYQITHSSISYIVDPFGRVVDYVPGAAGHLAVADKIREVI